MCLLDRKRHFIIYFNCIGGKDKVMDGSFDFELLTKEISRLREDNKEFKSEVSGLREDNKEFKNEIRGLRNEIESLENKIERLTLDLEKEKSKNKSLTEDLVKCIKIIHKLDPTFFESNT